MEHIRDHFLYDHARPEQMQKDGYLVKHLFNHNLINRRTYERLVRLPQIKEEDAVDVGSNSSHYHQSDHRRDSLGDHGTHTHKHRSEHNWHSPTGARRDREDLGELIPAPAVVYPDDAVPKPQERPTSSTYSSANMFENVHLQDSTILIRSVSSKHDEHQSIGHTGDETATKTGEHELYKPDTGRMGKGNSNSPSRVESPQSQDSSNIAPSSCSTDSPTPESDSFWLAEYSEEEDQKLDDNHPLIHFRGLAVTRILEAFCSWRGSHSEQEIPCDDGDESDPAPNECEGKGKGKDTENGKRKRADKSETNKNTTDSGDPSSNRVGCSKRRRRCDQQRTFACPYTKKDPMSYRDCYKYTLSRIRDVKQHLIRCHRNPLYCPRCMGTFQTEQKRDEHIREFSCPSRQPSRLDGITESQRSQLAKRSDSNTSPEDQWFAVFDILFPGHEPRPESPYIDSELLQGITLYQGFVRDHGPQILSELLIERGVVTSNLPNEERDLAAFLGTILAEGLRAVSDQWVAQSSSSQNSNVPSGSESIAQNTPPSSSSSGEMVGSNSIHYSRAVPTESSGSWPGGGPVEAHLDGEDVHVASSNQIPFSEGLDGSFNLELGNSDFLSELPFDGSDDELTRFFPDA